MSKATSSTAPDDRDASELPPGPEEVIAEHREVFEIIAEGADDDEIADLFGRQPLDYLADAEEVDDAA
jgi:hypothetical protein